MEYLVPVIWTSFAVTTINIILWAYKLGIWLRGYMQDDELLFSYKTMRGALDKDADNGKSK